ncbi:hypothetical protein SETIT_3G320000v2 [Setaria italica]|uniref:CCHC-type domain-containing protein n=1 Tax=Setaria italica TaxID=4555 RepID=K3ZCB4_SETIT|nr:hypothetical protein SETIT_3G320000v2 [Setaria italica]
MDRGFVDLKKTIAELVDRLPCPQRDAHAAWYRHSPDRYAYDAGDESPGLQSDGADYYLLPRHPPHRHDAHMHRLARDVDRANRDSNTVSRAVRVPFDDGLGKLKISIPSFSGSGNLSVDAYYKEMELLMIRMGVKEDEDATTSRFIRGLNLDVQERVETAHYYDMLSLVHVAHRVEQQLKARRASGRSRSFLHDDGCGAATKSVSFKPNTLSKDVSKSTAGSVTKVPSKAESSVVASYSTKECYTCGARGHLRKDCPNQKKVLMTKQGYVSNSLSEKSTNESIYEAHACDGYPDIDDDAPNHGLSLLAQETQSDGPHIEVKGSASIKAEVFPAARKKKDATTNTSKSRMALFQGREDDLPGMLSSRVQINVG